MPRAGDNNILPDVVREFITRHKAAAYNKHERHGVGEGRLRKIVHSEKMNKQRYRERHTPQRASHMAHLHFFPEGSWLALCWSALPRGVASSARRTPGRGRWSRRPWCRYVHATRARFFCREPGLNAQTCNSRKSERALCLHPDVDADAHRRRAARRCATPTDPLAPAGAAADPPTHGR